MAACGRPPLGKPDLTVAHRGSARVVIAVNIPALVAEARRADCLVELVPRVGEFVGVGEPLFRLFGGKEEASPKKLIGSVALAPERTIEQDATFAIRVIVDVAIKALSPAINDPTTGVLAIDQIHRLLRMIGQRHLHDEIVKDGDGKGRLVLRTPDWDDFVQLACCEYRPMGAAISRSRDACAMIEDLIANLPERRRPPLRQELRLLDQSINQLTLSPKTRRWRARPTCRGSLAEEASPAGRDDNGLFRAGCAGPDFRSNAACRSIKWSASSSMSP